MTNKLQNIVQKGHDNPVIMVFNFTGEFATQGLYSFNEIILSIGGEDYSTTLTPENLFLNSDTELRLRIGDSTALSVGSYIPEIIGFNSIYDDGYLLNGTTNRRLSSIQVRE